MHYGGALPWCTARIRCACIPPSDLRCCRATDRRDSESKGAASPLQLSLLDAAEFRTKRRDSGTLFCVCRGREGNDSMVECSRCGEWYHPRCIGLDQHQAHFVLALPEDVPFVCPLCVHRSGDAVFCACGQPYNEDSDMVACERCENWFHPECLGISPGRAAAIFKAGEDAPPFFCRWCQPPAAPPTSSA